MAKMKNKKNLTSSSRSVKSSRGLAQAADVEEYDAGFETDENDSESEAEETNFQAAGSRQASASTSTKPSLKTPSKTLQDIDPGQLLDTARNFIEGHPGRATLIGALVGGAIAGLFATEKGRSLVSAAYSYARPMIADYARNLINAQSQNAVEAALPQ